MRNTNLLLHLVFVVLSAATGPVLAEEIDDILAAGTAPPGVVFEVVSGDSDLLKDVLPAIHDNIKRLRTRFPGLDIAIVTHGEEQFALTTDNRESAPKLHAIAETLVDDQQVSLHVCGTYANWNDISAEEFPDFVNVSATGPAQINDYRELGYILVVLP